MEKYRTPNSRGNAKQMFNDPHMGDHGVQDSLHLLWLMETNYANRMTV